MSLMSASYPGGYYTNPGIGWRGATTGGARVMTRVPRDTREMGPPPSAMQSIPTSHLPPSPQYMDVPTPFVTTTPSHEAQVFRYVNTAVANLTLGTNKLADESSMMLPPSSQHLLDTNYDPVMRSPQEDSFATSSAVAIPVSDTVPGWKKVASSNGNSNSNQNAGGAAVPSGSPSKRSSLDIEKEINGQNLYKTELCRSFVETGTCRYGSKCQFAHGQSELRPVLRHPKYKTDYCKTFHTIGTCPYGTRCRFIHKRSEVEIGQNSIFLPPNANIPEWSVWNTKDAPDPTKQGIYGQIEQEKKPRSLSMKERRKTTDNQQLQKMEKNREKLQRVIGRQRSNTDSPPPAMRKKTPNAAQKKIPGPLGGKHDNVPPPEKGHRRRKSTGNSWSGPGADPAVAESGPAHAPAAVGSDADTRRGPEHIPQHAVAGAPAATINHVGHLNGVGMPLGGLPVVPVPVAGDEYLVPPVEDTMLLQDPLVPVEVEAPVMKEKARRRSSSSASRLPIFQELCTASEEEIAISLGATASTVVHRVLSSSS